MIQCEKCGKEMKKRHKVITGKFNGKPVRRNYCYDCRLKVLRRIGTRTGVKI